MSQNTGTFTKMIVAAMICVATPALAQKAKSGGSTSKATTKTETTSTTTSPGTTSPGAATSEDKLDVSDLENKYWAPKDTEFSVVQNRSYTKEKRFALLLSYGRLINDSFSDADNFTFSGSYFFNERYGIEVLGNIASPKDGAAVRGVRNLAFNTSGVIPAHNKVNSYYGVNFNWVPFYAKMALLEKKILYFDIMFSPGLGLTEYTNILKAGNSGGHTSPSLAFDISQQVFVNNTFAVRVDFRNRWFKEDIYYFSTGQKQKTDLTLNQILQIGLMIFF